MNTPQPHSIQLMQDVEIYIKEDVVLKSRNPNFKQGQVLSKDEFEHAIINHETIVEHELYLDFYNFNGSMFKKDMRHV